MKGLKIILLIFAAVCLLPPNVIRGQKLNMIYDTLKLNEVVVKGRPVMASSGFNRISVDSSLLTEYVSLSVSDILRKGTPLFIKSYGPGGISTVSMRGAGSMHTVVTWNGLNLNSPTLGQVDLLTVPSVAADEITIYNGGASVAVARGGLGGVVDIGTRPLWNSSPNHDITIAAGSYGRYSSSYIGRYGEGNWRFASRINFNQAANDFVYENSYLTGEITPEKRTNASFRQRAFIQEAWYKTIKSVTGMKIWFQESRRDIPVPINVSVASHDESLDNDILRAVVNHDRYFPGNTVLLSSAGVQSERLAYIDRVTGLFSESKHEVISLTGSLYSKPGERLSLKASLISESGFYHSSDYEINSVFRNISGAAFSADFHPTGILGLNANTAINFLDGRLIPPDFSAGIEITPQGGSDIVFRANIAGKSRVPSLNDLYWMPGGNPDLEPERGFSAETSIDLSHRISPSTKIALNGSLYANIVHDMIIWLPANSGIWTPRNNGDILARGTESDLSIDWISGNNAIRLLLCHTITVSTDRNERFQLIYVPRQMASSDIRITSGRFMAGVSLNYTGRRYITSDNSQYLPSYFITDGRAGISLGLKQHQVDLTARFENIFNTAYQIMAYHPMPSGSLMISAAVRFNTEEAK
ncbi:MAG: TonB-dependent receptor [Bacteroidales bacterium]|jgi:iron complex outermembrane receptor protein|nr:TonB-dependent receptor [Bacteroidales bacterium]